MSEIIYWMIKAAMCERRAEELESECIELRRKLEARVVECNQLCDVADEAQGDTLTKVDTGLLQRCFNVAKSWELEHIRAEKAEARVDKLEAENTKLECERDNALASVQSLEAGIHSQDEVFTSKYNKLVAENKRLRGRIDELGLVRESVRWFVRHMEEKLRENDDRGGWQDSNSSWLLLRLREEANELEEALRRHRRTDYGSDTSDSSADDVISECADIANFAMMIADNTCREKKP